MIKYLTNIPCGSCLPYQDLFKHMPDLLRQQEMLLHLACSPQIENSVCFAFIDGTINQSDV